MSALGLELGAEGFSFGGLTLVSDEKRGAGGGGGFVHKKGPMLSRCLSGQRRAARLPQSQSTSQESIVLPNLLALLEQGNGNRCIFNLFSLTE